MRAPFLNRWPLWVRRTLLTLLAVALIWSAAIWWLPAVLKPQIERLGGAALGRVVQVESISFQPWTLELTVRGLVVRSQDGASAQFGVRQLYVNLAVDSVFKLGPVIDALAVDEPHARVTQLAPGHYDIDDILARLASPSEKPSGKPLAFALYNLSLSGGTAELNDQVVGQNHTVRNLQVSLPFLSNFQAHREIKTEPRLAFQLNGSEFDSAAQSTPFVDSRRTELTLKVQQLDVVPYLGYVPAGLPVVVKAGVVDADIRLRFVQTPAPSLQLDGQLSLHKLALNDTARGELLQVERATVAIADVRPLERIARFDSLEIVAPRLSVRRDAQGRLNLVPAGVERAAAPAAAAASVPVAAPSAPAVSSRAVPAWTVSLAKAQLLDGRVVWADDAASPGQSARLQLSQLALQLEDVQYPFERPMRLKGSGALGSDADDGSSGKAAALAFSGSATDLAAEIQVKLDRASLGLVGPYLAAALTPRLQGEVSADLAVNWKADGGVVIAAEHVTLAQLSLGTGTRVKADAPAAAAAVRPQEASIRTLELRKARIDLARQAIAIELMRVDRPRVAIVRDAQGRWMFDDWRAAAPAGAATAPPSPASPAWSVALAALELDDGALSYADQSGARPVALGVTGLKLRMRDLHSDLDKPVRMQVSAAVGSGQAPPGSIGFVGQVTPSPLLAQGDVDVRQFPLHALEPYVGDALNVRVTRANTSYKGTLRYAAASAGPALKLSGDVGVEDLRVQQDAGSNRDLVTWNALRVRGLAVDMAPGAVTSVVVQETALTDFYARVIVDETGRINLQDLAKPAAAGAASAGSGGASGAPAVAASVAARPAAARDAALATADPSIRFGPIQLQNGRVLFSDRFVRPNYTANLTELNGRLSGFASTGVDGATPVLADLELKGRAEGTASLDISGKLNPLVKPLALDIRAKVRDLELPPLSPYAVKYVGHGIERGKLSVDLHYEVLPTGQLTASNNLVLNQLTFSDPVPGAPASLPVRLATALLSDRNGVIDLNLPIQGSLNDPQFSLGPVIMKAIGGLILKAVTAPFSLLASAVGGGGDGEALGQVDFAPGSAALDAAARQKLDKVATALVDRPAVKMSVAGSASLEVEGEAFKRARLQRMVQAEKRRNVVAGREPAAAPAPEPPGAAPGSSPGSSPSSAPASAPAPMEVGAAEYPALLTSLYRRAELPDKPRNAIGMTKDVPVAEMESRLLASMAVSEDAIRNLALQRGVAVRDYLASKALPLDRLFLGAPKNVTGDAGWTPRADLDLAMP